MMDIQFVLGNHGVEFLVWAGEVAVIVLVSLMIAAVSYGAVRSRSPFWASVFLGVLSSVAIAYGLLWMDLLMQVVPIGVVFSCFITIPFFWLFGWVMVAICKVASWWSNGFIPQEQKPPESNESGGAPVRAAESGLVENKKDS